MLNKPIQLKSIKDVHFLAESFQSETGDPDGPWTFNYTTFSHIDADGFAYTGEIPTRKKLITLQQFQENLKLIPDKEIYPIAPKHITNINILPDDEFYIKRPKLTTYHRSKGQDLLAKLLLQEVEIMELLKNNPHPHIVSYHGCIIRDDYIIGIALDKYHTTLERRLEDRDQYERNFDTESCFKAIESAIKHLHSLGLAHNDINPMNVMVDNEDTTFLIDFGSCQPFGADLITTGTPGWMEDELSMTSKISNDEFALAKLRSWFADVLTGTVKKPEYPEPSPEELARQPTMA
jgi:serine/threonine protein kinase